MAGRGPGDDSGSRSGLAALGVAALAAVCCAALPLIAGLVGSVAVGALLGLAAGFAAAALLVGVAVSWVRHRRGA